MKSVATVCWKGFAPDPTISVAHFLACSQNVFLLKIFAFKTLFCFDLEEKFSVN